MTTAPLDRLFVGESTVDHTHVLPELPFAEYQISAGMNASALTKGCKSPLNFHHAAHVERVDSRGMRVGRAVHCRVLEPDKYDDQFVVWPGARRGADYIDFRNANLGLDILTPSEEVEASVQATAVADSPRAQELLAHTDSEVSVFAPLFGIQFKGRLDAVDPTNHRIVDLKTTADIGREGRSFGYRFDELHYGLQLWIYRELLKVITGEDFAVDLIVVESSPPNDVVCIPVHPPVLDNYGRRVEELAATLLHCYEEDCWPGVGGEDETVELMLPARAMQEDEVIW